MCISANLNKSAAFYSSVETGDFCIILKASLCYILQKTIVLYCLHLNLCNIHYSALFPLFVKKNSSIFLWPHLKLNCIAAGTSKISNRAGLRNLKVFGILSVSFNV